MSQLYLLRHAKAEWAKPGMRDIERPLRERGRRDAQLLGSAMREAGYVPDRVLCSTAARALETWQALSKTLGAGDCDVEFTESLYGTDAAGYLQVVNDAFGAERLLMVGHNPMTEDIAFALSESGDQLALAKLEMGFPTCGMAAIEFALPLTDAAPGKGVLLDFMTPSEF